MAGKAQLPEGSKGSSRRPGFAAVSIRIHSSTCKHRINSRGENQEQMWTVVKPQMIQRQADTSKMAPEEELPDEFPKCPAGCWGRNGEAHEGLKAG